jgi:hypothetical protein
MRNIAKVVIIFVSVSLVILTANYTLSSNLDAGIYPINADSIGIPLVETVAASLVFLVFLLTAFVFTTFLFFRKRLLIALGLLLYALAAFVAGDMAWSWLIPHHYSIAISYGLVATVAVTFAIFVLRNAPLTTHSNGTR